MTKIKSQLVIELNYRLKRLIKQYEHNTTVEQLLGQ